MKNIIYAVGCLVLISCISKKEGEVEEKIVNQHELDSLKRVECDSLLCEIKRIEADTFGPVNQIPRNFDECLVTLDTLVNSHIQEWIKCLPDGEFSSFVHFGFGMYLRNNWGLWGNSVLYQDLFKMGILHPDDMSSIILDSYQRKLKGEDIRLEEQLKYYQDYWKESGVNVDSVLAISK